MNWPSVWKISAIRRKNRKQDRGTCLFSESLPVQKDTAELAGGKADACARFVAGGGGAQAVFVDELTAELDPIASEQFVALLGRLNQELGITILLVEQRLDSVLSFRTNCRRAAGEIIVQGKPEEVLSRLENPERVVASERREDFPRLKGKRSLSAHGAGGRRVLKQIQPEESGEFSEKIEFGQRVLKIRNLWFAYEKHSEVF